MDKEIIKRWNLVTSAVNGLNDKQVGILSQLLENLESTKSTVDHDIESMAMTVSLTCRVFEKIKDSLPEETYPMTGPVDTVNYKNTKIEISAISRVLDNEYSVEYYEDLKNEILNCDIYLIDAMAHDLAEELKKYLKGDSYFPYILLSVCKTTHSNGSLRITFRTRVGKV
jgi:hypothetical protein